MQALLEHCDMRETSGKHVIWDYCILVYDFAITLENGSHVSIEVAGRSDAIAAFRGWAMLLNCFAVG